MQARSLAEIPEDELVQTIWTNDILRPWAFGFCLADPADIVHLRVPLQALSAGAVRGDADLLLLRGGRPEHAVAYEVKRIKVTNKSFQTGVPNKLPDLRKAVRQANQLRDMGFSRVFLTVLIVTDGRNRNGYNFIFRGATPAMIDKVTNTIELGNLHPDVGVVRVEVTQPVDREFTEAGGVGGRLLRQAALREQPAVLTTSLNGAANAGACDKRACIAR